MDLGIVSIQLQARVHAQISSNTIMWTDDFSSAQQKRACKGQSSWSNPCLCCRNTKHTFVCNPVFTSCKPWSNKNACDEKRAKAASPTPKRPNPSIPLSAPYVQDFSTYDAYSNTT
eukprot:1157683-Pelagomonas_calceolata.AAC.6